MKKQYMKIEMFTTNDYPFDMQNWAKTQPDIATAWDNCPYGHWLEWIIVDCDEITEDQRKEIRRVSIYEIPVTTPIDIKETFGNDIGEIYIHLWAFYPPSGYFGLDSFDELHFQPSIDKITNYVADKIETVMSNNETAARWYADKIREICGNPFRD